MAGAFDRRDRSGHSFKLGHGAVNARAAALAGGDPVCLALLATREVPDPGPGEVNPAFHLAVAWEESVRAAAAVGPLGLGYLQARARLGRLYLRSPGVQEALGWLARHARALYPDDVLAPGPELGCWGSPTEDHGALAGRLLHVADTLRQALTYSEPEAGDPAVLAWLDAVEDALACSDGGEIARRMSMCLAGALALARRARGLGEIPQGWNLGDVVVESGDDGRGGQA
jgi:hypothetical protein